MTGRLKEALFRRKITRLSERLYFTSHIEKTVKLKQFKLLRNIFNTNTSDLLSPVASIILYVFASQNVYSLILFC